jgi:type IV pilus assembly protein PilP
MSRLINAQRIATVVLIGVVLCLGGCDGQKGNKAGKEPVVTKQIAKTEKKTPASEQKDTAAAGPQKADAKPVQVAEAESITAPEPKRMPYNPAGKLDPFAPLYKEEQEKEAKKVVARPKGPERPRTPLEKLDLAQLKLTAIVSAGNERRALVEEVSGKGYVVEVGTRIGLERGKIIEIAPDRIIIEHEDEDDFGKASSKKRELKLQKPPGD